MDLFLQTNRTELYQIARAAGFSILPETPRAKIIAYLTGEEEPEEVKSLIDSWRHGIIGFLLDHWKQVETQLTCPAKDLANGGTACFTCIDTQVICCLVSNEKDLHLIKLHKK